MPWKEPSKDHRRVPDRRPDNGQTHLAVNSMPDAPWPPAVSASPEPGAAARQERRRQIRLRRRQGERPPRRNHDIPRLRRQALRLVRPLRRRPLPPPQRPAHLAPQVREIGQGVELMAAAAGDLDGHLKLGETGEHPARAGARCVEGAGQRRRAEQRRRGQEIDGVGQPGTAPRRRFG
jgi:hypothetical protein